MPSKFHPTFRHSPAPSAAPHHPPKGAHAATCACALLATMARPSPPLLAILLLFISSVAAIPIAPSGTEALLGFKGHLDLTGNKALATWIEDNPPCSDNRANWVGVLCEKDEVWGLQLESMGLRGRVDIDSLATLPQLRSVSFMNNSFEGTFPDFKRLGALKSLYLSNNRFSGEIVGEEFSNMLSLKKVHLANNLLEGAIPWSLVQLPKLLELRLEGNRFTGEIPNIQQRKLKSFNVSNNHQLQGPIPLGLSQMDPSSFAGDNGLCGKPLDKDCTIVNRPTILSIILVAIAVVVALIAIGAGVVILNRRNHPSSEEDPPHNLQHKSGAAKELDQAVMAGGARSPDRGSSHGSSGKRASEQMKLSFVREDAERFDLSDLLKASAEILGSGYFGSSYKAALMSGPVMVVKRFKQMNNVGREEFHDYMRKIGRLRHPNLLPLVAYYYKKEEKLLLSNYIEKGSLAVQLHGHQALGQPPLNWPTRLKIVKGIGKGLRYLYGELPCLISPHGHLKSSNVLLKASYEPLLTDYGLVPVVNQEHAQEHMVAYKSPEYSQHGRITKKTDVWSLGLLILEILTGKFPASFLHLRREGDDEDLPSWVKSVPQQEWPNRVIEKDVIGPSKSGEGEILKLLRIGLACCENDVEKRMDLREAVEKIEELKEKDGDDEFFSTCASEADVRSSRGLSDELNFNI